MIQLIEKQRNIFRLKINGIEHSLIGIDLYRDQICSLPKKLKGTTIGWNTTGKFISYWQIKKEILKQSPLYEH